MSEDTSANVKVGSLQFVVDYDDGDTYRWRLIFENREWSDNNLRGPKIGPSPTSREMLGTMLAFLEAALESRSYRLMTGRGGENEDLFPADMLDACEAFSGEISIARIEIEEPDGECSDPNGPDCHDDSCSLHYGEYEEDKEPDEEDA